MELSVGMVVGAAIASICLVLFNQQVAFLQIFRAQSFLNEEAPIISTHVSKLVAGADRFRLHENIADALSGNNPSLSDSPVLVLNFRQPDGSMRAGILAWQNLGQGDALYYYVVPETGVLATPQWSITNKPADVSFSVTHGILRTRMTGPAGEEITYSGAMP